MIRILLKRLELVPDKATAGERYVKQTGRYGVRVGKMPIITFVGIESFYETIVEAMDYLLYAGFDEGTAVCFDYVYDSNLTKFKIWRAKND